MATPTAAELATQLPTGDVIKLADVSRLIGWTPNDQWYAVRTGRVDVVQWDRGRARPKNAAHRVTRDEALKIVAAAAIAFAAGLAIVTVLTAVKAAGLNIPAMITGAT